MRESEGERVRMRKIEKERKSGRRIETRDGTQKRGEKPEQARKAECIQSVSAGALPYINRIYEVISLSLGVALPGDPRRQMGAVATLPSHSITAPGNAARTLSTRGRLTRYFNPPPLPLTRISRASEIPQLFPEASFCDTRRHARDSMHTTCP